MKILVINGPNLNMLGVREPEKYGLMTLESLELYLKNYADEMGIQLDFFQSNFEGEIVERIQCSSDYDGLIINAGAYTHTSIAIRDALLSVGAKFIEVHMSNVFAREEFRHKSYLSDIALGVIVGLKEQSYILALEYFSSELE